MTEIDPRLVRLIARISNDLRGLHTAIMGRRVPSAAVAAHRRFVGFDLIHEMKNANAF